MKQISPIITPFRWYDEFYQQDRYKNYCDSCEFKLITDRRHILPFQFKRTPSGYGIDKWLLREACVTPQNKLFTSKDSLFSSETSWQNNGEFVFDCGNACSGSSSDADELLYAGVLTIGKTYTFNLLVNDYQVTTSGIFYKLYNGATFIQNINSAGLVQITFVATSADIILQFNAPNPIGDDYICITEVQITEAVEQLAADIELDITKLELANAGIYDYISYCGQNFTTTLPIGDYYCIIIDLEGKTYFSEIITIRDFFHEKSPYYILEWKNTCIIDDVIYGGSNGCTYSNQLYLDEAVISKPEYPYIEEVEENGNRELTATFQKWEKTINFLIAKCPEFITDALSAITLHDTIFITEPIRKKQEISDGSITIKSVQVDIRPVIDDCFSNVELTMLLNDKYLDSSCCLESPFEVCATCEYEAQFYNQLPEEQTEALYALITDPGVDVVGLYQWSILGANWVIVALPIDSIVCFGSDFAGYTILKYVYSEDELFHQLPTIGAVVYNTDSYFISGWATPDSYVQVETSTDLITWTPQLPIENAAVFQLVGIQLVMAETDPIYFRVRNFSLNCNYGYSGIFNWTPELLNPIAWFKSDIGVTEVGGLVSRWDDQSGNGNHLFQGTDTQKPTLTANQLNSYPGIVFDGLDNYLKAATFALTQAETIFIVYKKINNAQAFVFDGNTINTGQLIHEANNDLKLSSGGTITTSVKEFVYGAFALVTAIFSGAASKLQLNSDLQFTDDAGAADLDGFTLGCKGDNASGFANISVIEIIIIPSLSSTTDRQLVKDYIKAKYLI